MAAEKRDRGERACDECAESFARRSAARLIQMSRRPLSVERKVVLRFASRDSVKPAGLVDVRARVQAGERVLVRACGAE